AGRMIYLAADEDEVEFIRSFGFVATCCASGVENWRPEYSSFLQGADVVLYNGAKIIAQSLAPIVRRLRTLDFANDNAEDLVALTAAAKDYAPATEETGKSELDPAPNEATDDAAEPDRLINIPPALKPLTEHKRWLIWRWEQKKNGKWTKVPYQGHAPSR